MGKLLVWFFIIAIITVGGGYYHYSQTGYKFGLDDTFLFKGTIGVSTKDFVNGEEIPTKFTCDGNDVSPELTLTRVPSETKSLAILLEDQTIKPKPFTHWIVFNFNSELNIIDSSTAWQNGSIGINDFGNSEYQGPCPPTNEIHKYVFKVYALNLTIQNESLNRVSFDKFIEGHVLATGSLMGVYSKKP